jgi:2-oxoglutarate dehydrogenase E2 component (dihydrolipoamide succinyltransferase)
MPTDVIMPQMGESIFEGAITKWLKQPGDSVLKDEPLLEISTDKVDAEIPAPAAGILVEIKVPEGATVGVNTVLAVIDSAVTPAARVPAAAIPAPKAAPESAPAAPQQPKLASSASLPSAQEPAPAVQPARRIRSSPLVRRIAKEKNVDLALVPGTGSDGRITKEDILRYLAQPRAATPAARAVAPSAPAQQPVAPAAPLPAEPVPLTRMRAIIAQRMVESVQISPHVHTVYKADMTRIVRLRERVKGSFEQRHGVRLTYMPFIATAAIQALRRFPIVNASLVDGPQGQSILYHPAIHLGIAVALDWGLIVPVVRNADQLGFPQLARAIADLAARARAKKLSPDEVGSSTFTLTNSGIFGEEFGTPIINQPDSAILAIGSLAKQPAVVTDTEGNDSIAIRSVQYFCLGFDHRTIDGADAGRFMTAFKTSLETWDLPID